RSPPASPPRPSRSAPARPAILPLPPGSRASPPATTRPLSDKARWRPAPKPRRLARARPRRATAPWRWGRRRMPPATARPRSAAARARPRRARTRWRSEGAQALATNSVAIGNNTVADQPNTASLGGRRLTNIAPGIASSDAATVGQLRRNENRLSGGIAAAAALGGAIVPDQGRTLDGRSGATYNGEGGF